MCEKDARAFLQEAASFLSELQNERQEMPVYNHCVRVEICEVFLKIVLYWRCHAGVGIDPSLPVCITLQESELAMRACTNY